MSSMLSRSVVPEVLTTRTRTLPATLRLVAVNRVNVVELAVKTANLIGDGLYGVDLKQSGDKVVVIEVNDNPNLDAGIEDAYLQDDLYSLVLEEFVRRLELKRQGQVW